MESSSAPTTKLGRIFFFSWVGKSTKQKPPLPSSVVFGIPRDTVRNPGTSVRRCTKYKGHPNALGHLAPVLAKHQQWQQHEGEKQRSGQAGLLGSSSTCLQAEQACSAIQKIHFWTKKISNLLRRLHQLLLFLDLLAYTAQRLAEWLLPFLPKLLQLSPDVQRTESAFAVCDDLDCELRRVFGNVTDTRLFLQPLLTAVCCSGVLKAAASILKKSRHPITFLSSQFTTGYHRERLLVRQCNIVATLLLRTVCCGRTV